MSNKLLLVSILVGLVCFTSVAKCQFPTPSLSPSRPTNSSTNSGNCHLREIDLCISPIVAITQLAQNDVELNRQCAQVKDVDGCLRNYARRCMSPLQREILGFVTNASLGAMMLDYCTSGRQSATNRANYFKHAKCMAEFKKSSAHKNCVRDTQAVVDMLVSPGGDHGKRLQLGCCAYSRFEACASGQLEKRCGKDALIIARTAIHKLTSRLPEVACKNYKIESNECKALLPKTSSTSNIPSSNKTNKTFSASNSVISRLFAAYINTL